MLRCKIRKWIVRSAVVGSLAAATDWWILRAEETGFIETSEGQWG
jgi:hypothetical protein